MTHGEINERRDRHVLIQSARALAVYVALAVFLFGRDLFARFAIYYIGNGTDPTESMWFLRWWPHALHHGLNPFFTRLVWAPEGTSLAWATSIPLPSFAAAPLTLGFGPIAAYNVLCLAAPVLAAFTAFLLCRYITKSFWPSLLGGFIFGFSPYMLGQLLSHLDLTMVFPIPLVALALAMKYRREIGGAAYVAMLSGAMVVEFLCFPELFATLAMFTALAAALGFLLLPNRKALSEMILPTAVAGGVTILVLSPYVIEMMLNRPPSAPLYSPAKYSADLLNFIVPTRTNLLGMAPLAAAITGKFRGIIYEQGACLGIPLILIVEGWRRDHWRQPETRLAIWMLLIVCVAAIGPVLNIGGKPTLPAPWAIFGRVPLIQVALPGRFMVYAFLLAAVIAASWLAFSPARRSLKWAAAGAVVIFMMPNPAGSFWVSKAQLPAFFADGMYRSYLTPREMILALPYERTGSSMLWQASADMSFRMAGGYTTRVPFEFARLPIVGFFLGAIDLPEAADQLKAFIASKDVSAIVADNSAPRSRSLQAVVNQLGIAPIEAGGVAIYRVPAGSFASYGAVAPARLEQRAIALRMDALVQACAKYLAEKRPVGGLSALALKRANLLPADWKVSTDPLAYTDYVVTDYRGKIEIGLGGSYDALYPLGERYRGLATRIYYPFPTPWSPARKYARTEVTQPMVFEFDPSAIAAVAAALEASPPPERITPFPQAAPGASEVKSE